MAITPINPSDNPFGDLERWRNPHESPQKPPEPEQQKNAEQQIEKLPSESQSKKIETPEEKVAREAKLAARRQQDALQADIIRRRLGL